MCGLLNDRGVTLQQGRPCHSYTDHASILKFIEKNWGTLTISKRSRDNLPNPKKDAGSYVPASSPAIGDMMDMFDFSDHD
jgi:phospholipase C